VGGNLKANTKKSTRKRTETPFGKNLKATLDERGISQRGAAEIMAVSVSVVNDWLNGAAPNDVLAVQKLCKALSCDFEWLLAGNKEHVDPKKLSLQEIFEIQDEPDFSGVWEISARRLKRKCSE